MTDPVGKKKKKTSQVVEIWKRLKKNRMAMVGLYMLAAIVVLSVFGPLLSPYDYAAQNYTDRLLFPCAAHIFGTDNFGRDILTRILVGGRYTLFITFVCITMAALIGSALGLLAAFYPRLDNIVMRIVDIFMGIPTMLMCVSIVAALGSSMENMMIALIVTQSPEFARIMRAQVLTLKDREYMEAAQSIGCSNLRVILHHVVPNALAPVIVQYTLGAVSVILMSASLSFVGMGVQPPTPEWGLMISAGRDYLRDYWHIAIIPGLAIVATAFALNMLGDGLRDALDPRLKQ
ncbi:ABC transporter permease [Enterocloster lavalensis]|uniref:ABC transporter permease n=1 Tax=Enterocloster lavalensis TaxID=460384 RepID=UPI000D1A11D5|nr:ABC transporter permease [Enterocloster lavalensis]PST35297.1 ABC transporter permease [Enterocloster lavalensis]